MSPVRTTDRTVPDLATIILILLVALGLWWKLRCIWRGCTVDTDKDAGD